MPNVLFGLILLSLPPTNDYILANSYFQFKQFKVNQEGAAMKVCTDSCIFGAFIQPSDAKTILDIGTGTGLLSLMIAQRCSAFIDAVEIDESAAQQATENVLNSPWKDKIKIHHSSIQNFPEQKYDLIISNPPFYENSLKSPNDSINSAHHSTLLTREELLKAVKSRLTSNGVFWVLLPPYQSELLREEALEYGLYVSSIIIVKDTYESKALREITTFSFELNMPKVNEFTIKNKEGYTQEFNSLLKEYYLNL